jgi:SAM-dependent methyltransferase
MFGSLVVKVRRSLARQGVWGTLRHALSAANRELRELTPAARRERRMQEAIEQEFDRTYNVDTAGLVDLSTQNMDNPNWMYGSRYQGIGPQLFREMVESTGIHYPDFLFIDLGSGKGRALLLASEFPFQCILGVEFSPKLVEISQWNIQRFRSDKQQCQAISVICEDAAAFHFPSEPIVLFMYNPFDHHVMTRVIENIGRSLENSMQEVIVLYTHPVHGELWDRSDLFRKVKSTPSYAVWRSARATVSNRLTNH